MPMKEMADEINTDIHSCVSCMSLCHMWACVTRSMPARQRMKQMIHPTIAVGTLRDIHSTIVVVLAAVAVAVEIVAYFFLYYHDC